ncbi:retrotransposon protein, putative, ty1-copia subclass [Tanacetum coccineum]|uniref:Retrotransposon protein, putative, ty1-copia subclass n=1 Tax=Tanacetum coccineum TaxID=301880 RepID=A0ABQ4YMH0_9ASTR
MTTSVVNNSVFKGFFEKQKLTRPNFIDWYRKLGIVLSVEDKLNYLEHPIPAALVSAHAGQQVPLEALATHAAWVKGQKEIAGLMLMTMEPDIQRNLENLGAYDMLQELKTLYIDNLERLGHPGSLNLAVGLILVSLRKKYNSFVQNYNMHDIRKTVNELHVMLKLHEQTLPKKDALHAIRAVKDLRRSRKLKPGALSMYMGNGQRATVEAIGSYHLCFPSGLVVILHNFHYAPSITRGVILVSRLYDDGFINRFEDNAISVYRNNVVYFCAVPRDGIYEIDLSNSNTNVSSMYAVSNKRAKLNLDSSLLWHCRLGHISKKRIKKLQHDGLLNSTNTKSFEKCVSCMSRKMAQKTYSHQVERAKDLLGFNAHRYNKVWDLVDLPPNGKIVSSKWLFKKNTDMDGVVHTYKARLITKGFTQTYRVDFEEIFSLVADIRAIRILIVIVVFYDYEIWQIDVKITFLNGHLSEEVYMVQPEGLVNLKYPNRVCKLKHSIYGLKQASRQWNKRFDDEIKKFGFTQNHDEPCVYKKANGSNVTFLILYVDDILIIGNHIPKLQDVKSYLGKCFAMKDLGEAAYNLGIKIYRDRSRRLIGLCQSAYIEKILKRFFMVNSKHGSIPMQEKLKLCKSQCASTPTEVKRIQNIPYALIVGSIIYAMRCTLPDVAFAQNITRRFQQNPGKLHWTAVKNIMKYLCNTKDMFFIYEGDIKRELRVSCYTNVGYLTDADDLKSQTGYVFILNGAEYIAASDASKEAVWVRKFISWLGVVPTNEEPIKMYCDNTRAITIANVLGITKGARHYRAKVHYLREVIEFGDVKIENVYTDDNLADPFTK